MSSSGRKKTRRSRSKSATRRRRSRSVLRDIVAQQQQLEAEPAILQFLSQDVMGTTANPSRLYAPLPSGPLFSPYGFLPPAVLAAVAPEDEEDVDIEALRRNYPQLFYNEEKARALTGPAPELEEEEEVVASAPAAEGAVVDQQELFGVTWQQIRHPDGIHFYFVDMDTGHSQYERPFGWVGEAGGPARRGSVASSVATTVPASRRGSVGSIQPAVAAAPQRGWLSRMFGRGVY